MLTIARTQADIERAIVSPDLDYVSSNENRQRMYTSYPNTIILYPTTSIPTPTT